MFFLIDSQTDGQMDREGDSSIRPKNLKPYILLTHHGLSSNRHPPTKGLLPIPRLSPTIHGLLVHWLLAWTMAWLLALLLTLLLPRLRIAPITRLLLWLLLLLLLLWRLT